MKQLLLTLTGIAMSFSLMAQTDSTKQSKVDTIRIGGMIIIKDGSEAPKTESKPKINADISIGRNYKKTYRPKNITTNWGIFDLGFTNWTDNSVYPNALTAPNANADWMNLNNGKSVNVNIWFFMQRINMIQHVVNLKYGLGLELNNYRFEKQNVDWQKNPTLLTENNTVSYSKNKMAMDYVTLPVMLNFNFTPNRREGFGISAGVSAGYLYSARQKTKSGANGIEKTKSDFDLNPFKLSYIAELSLGPVKFYGSYAAQNIWEKGFDVTPYSFGLRFSNW